MRKTHKIKFKAVISALVLTFGLSFVNLPETFADSSYFDAIGSDANLSVLSPGDEAWLSVTVVAKKKMKLYGADVYFTPTDSNDPAGPVDEDLGLRDLGIRHSQMDGCTLSLNYKGHYNGNLTWNMNDSDHTYDDRDYVDVEPGDTLFSAYYVLDSDATSLMRSFPVTIGTAYIGDENGITETLENITLPANLYVTSGSGTDIITIYKHVEGNGVVLAPNLIRDGDNLHIEVIPDEGYEVRYASIDGYYFGEELVDNAFDIVVHSDGEATYYNIYADFWKVNEVIEGDGAEYIAGSDEDLSFKIDGDLENFDGQGIVGVDGEYLSSGDEWTVDADAKTVTLKSDFLATLGVGEHSIEFIFFYGEMSVARANFVIVEAEEEAKAETDEPLVPNTGTSTASEQGGAASPIVASIICGGIVSIATFFTLRRRIQK